MIFTIIAVLLGILVVGSAFAAVYMKNLASAVVASGVASLFVSVIYLLLAAPDVAITEAAIGSGLTTIVFFYALNKIKKEEPND
jgi:uncharacterized MnhB-related membrane protein